MKILKVFLWVAAILVVVYFVNLFFNVTVYNPAVAIPAFRWMLDHNFIKTYSAITHFLKIESEGQYPLLSFQRLQDSLYFEARAAVTGTVTDVQKSTDGDWHVNLKDAQNRVLVMEIIPELPLPVPKIGTKIKIWGITRYDIAHRWWELHPIIGWQAVP